MKLREVGKLTKKFINVSSDESGLNPPICVQFSNLSANTEGGTDVMMVPVVKDEWWKGFGSQVRATQAQHQEYEAIEGARRGSSTTTNDFV